MEIETPVLSRPTPESSEGLFGPIEDSLGGELIRSAAIAAVV